MVSCCTDEDMEGTSALWQAMAACVRQRLETLHERLLRLEYSCTTQPAEPLKPAHTASGPPAARAAEGTAAEDKSGESNAEGSRVIAESVEARLKMETRRELGYMADELISLCQLSERLTTGDSELVAGTSHLVLQCHDKILAYAGDSRIVAFFTELLSASAKYRTGAKQSDSSGGAGSQGPAASRRGKHTGVSFSEAAQQLLEDQELWEVPETAQHWPQAVVGCLRNAALIFSQPLLHTAADANGSDPSGSQAAGAQASFVSKEGDDVIQVCLWLMRTIAQSTLDGDAVLGSVHRQYRIALEITSRPGEESAPAAEPWDALNDDDDMGPEGTEEALVEAQGLFRLLCGMPLQWLAKHAEAAKLLLGASLAVQSILLVALHGAMFEVMQGHVSADSRQFTCPATLTAAAQAAGSVHSFMARLAAAGSDELAAELVGISFRSGLNWPFAASSAMQTAALVSHFHSPSPSGGRGQAPSQASPSEGSAAIICQTSKHLFLSQGRPAPAGSPGQSHDTLLAWMEFMQSHKPAGANVFMQMLLAQQLEAVCAALRSAATSAMTQGRAAEAPAGRCYQFLCTFCEFRDSMGF